MDEVYFRHPWRDLRVHSLVLGGDPGDVQGFLGVIPRPMDFGGRRIVAAIVGNLMVRPDDRRVPMFAAVKLAREFLGGEQDVSLTETANDAGRKAFLAAGGTTARLCSFGWRLPVRPFAAAMHEISRPAVRVLTRPLCSMADWLCSGRGRRPWSLAGVRREPLQVDDLVHAIPKLSGYRVLPAYDNRSLDWLLRMAATKTASGLLQRTLVRDDSGAVVGWYVYYLRRRGISQVLQLSAEAPWFPQVFGSLFDEAMSGGSIGLRGRLDPLYMAELSRANCRFRASSWAICHSRNAELLQSFAAGEALFSGLESEQWTRFVGDPFEY